MHRWFKRTRRSRIVNADLEKFHGSFELLKKHQADLRTRDGGYFDQDVKVAVEAGEEFERFINEFLEQQSCR